MAHIMQGANGFFYVKLDEEELETMVEAVQLYYDTGDDEIPGADKVQHAANILDAYNLSIRAYG